MNSPMTSEKTLQMREQAARQIRAGQLDAAMANLEAVIDHVPQDVPACLQLADLLLARGKFRDSSRPLLKAAQHLPRNVPLLVQLAQHLIASGEVVTARRCLDFLAEAPDPPSDVWLAQAHIRFSLGEVAMARKFLERALAAGADDPDDHHMHAMLLQFTGDIEGACTVLEQCLERWPHYGDAAVVLVNLRKQKPEANRLRHVEEQLSRLSLDPPRLDQKFVRADFEYARFKILDDLDRCEEAWSSLERCNALMQELNPYDREGEEAVTEALVNMPFASHAHVPGAPGPGGPVPIFIVGMPRSGTTLLDRMLSSHSDVTAAGELIEFWRQLHWVADVPPAKTQSLCRITGRHDQIDFDELGRRYLEQSQWRAQGRGFYVDKLPANVQMVEFIKRALPHAPILNMVRDPMDVCFSNLKAMFGNIAPFSYSMDAMAHYYRQYARLCDYWRTRSSDLMLDVSYARLVREPEDVMREVLAYCGLGLQEACLHPERNAQPVATPSSAQVRQAIHTRGLGQWRRYAGQLRPLEDALRSG